MALAAGARLGPYEILSSLGAGGMGEVYRARDPKLNRDVALKVLPDAFAADGDRLARFKREAQVLASLNHPHIAAIYGFEDSGSTHALVLELVDGPTLADRIAQGPIPLEETLPIAQQTAEALEAAHEQGIIHRDLKPANIKLRPDGTVKVLDFGLAKALEPPSGVHPDMTASPTITTPAMTGMGMILGTAAYMSPEQAKGRPADKRSDIWAFGCVLCEMLTGERAFIGEEVSDTLASVLAREPNLRALPQEVPPAIRTLLQGCLAKDRKQRIADISTVLFVMNHPSSVARVESTTLAPAVAIRPPRWRRLAGLAVAAVVASTVTGTVAWLAARRSPPKLQPMRFALVPPAAQPLIQTVTDRQVAISPDGRNLAYIAVVGGVGQLMVRAIDRLDAEPLRGIANARFPFMSPDGRWIGFFQGAQELRKVSVTGGPSIALCPITGGPRGASWGPDDTIVFATADATTGLLTVPAGGGEPKVLTTPDVAHGEADHLFPSVLPGGRAVLFTIVSPGPIESAQVAVLDLKTGQHKTLIRGGSDAQYVEPGYLLYAAAGTLRAVRFDPVKLELESDPVPVVEQVSVKRTGAADYGISRTGELVFVPGTFSSIAGSAAARSLVWVDRQGREEPIKAPARAYFALRLSPDGTRIAVDIRDQENDIWVWDLARQTLTRLTFDPLPDTFPIWTPDGRRIVFSSSRGGAVPNLFWQPADGTGTVERLTTSAIAQFPNSFSPDGTQLVLQDGGTGSIAGETSTFDISLLPMDGKGKTARLIQTKANQRNADISPDGHWVAYESNVDGQFQVYVQPFPNVNSGRWQISASGGTKPVWARNGRELFYVDGNNLLVTVPVQTSPSFSAGNPAKVLEAKYFYGVQQSRSYDVSRDSQRFVMIKDAPADTQKSNETPASLVVVLNWLEELKQKLPTK